MTDRIAGFIVTLDQDIRDDDVEPIIAAIRQLRHVISVTPLVSSPDLHMAAARVRSELSRKLWEALK